MKVAVCLTGLCNIDPSNIKKVFKVFDHLTETRGIHFDFYMQFWNNHNHYFYELSETLLTSKTFLRVPTIKNEIYSQIIYHLKPKEIIGLNFTDTVLKSGLDQNKKYTRDENNAMAVRYNGPEFVDVDTFKKYEDGLNWCCFHNSYVDFVNQRAQFYSLQEVVKTVPKNEYDIILKWRYDILTDYKKVLKTIKIEDNIVYVPGLYRKKHNKPLEEIRSIITKNKEYTYAILDMWLYAKEKEFRKFCDNLLNFSINNYDDATLNFRNLYDTASPLDESAFLDKILNEGFVVRPVGACETRIIHPLYKIPNNYFTDPVTELKNMQVDCDNRYNLFKINNVYARGEFGSENSGVIRGINNFILPRN